MYFMSKVSVVMDWMEWVDSRNRKTTLLPAPSYCI